MSLLFSVPSLADEDGAFCTFKGYLGYEMREGMTPSVSGHVLRVIRFDGQHGIYTAGDATLQDFQVHHMTCFEDRVEISGWANIFKRYIVSIAGKGSLQVLNFVEDPARKFDRTKDGPEPHQLAFDKPGPQPLESDDPEHKYTLLLTAWDKTVEGGVEHHKKAEILQTDFHGAVSQRVPVYETAIVETID